MDPYYGAEIDYVERPFSDLEKEFKVLAMFDDYKQSEESFNEVYEFWVNEMPFKLRKKLEEVALQCHKDDILNKLLTKIRARDSKKTLKQNN